MLNVPRALSVPPPGIGVLSRTWELPRAGQVRLRSSRREPRISKRAAGSTASSMIVAPPFSNCASRRVTCMPGTGPPAPAGVSAGGAGRSGRRAKSARSESSPRASRATSAHGVFTYSRSMTRRVGQIRSRPVASTRPTLSSGRVASRNATLPAPTLPRTASSNGSIARVAATSASAAPRTRPAMGSHGWTVVRSTPRSFSASCARLRAASTVPRAVTSPPATPAASCTRAVVRDGQLRSSAVNASRVTSTRPPLAASVTSTRPSAMRRRLTSTSTGGRGVAGPAAAGADAGGRASAARLIAPPASRSRVRAGCSSASSAMRTRAGAA